MELERGLQVLEGVLPAALMPPSEESEAPAEEEDGQDLEVAAQILSKLAVRFKTLGQLKSAVTAACERASALVSKTDSLESEEVGSVDDSQRAKNKAVTNAMLSTLFYVQQAAGAAVLSHRAFRTLVAASENMIDALPSDEEADLDAQIVAGVSKFTAFDNEDANRLQQLILYMLSCAQARGYRRMNGECYKRRYTPEGHDTHSWVRESSIQDFVYEMTRKEVNYEMWLNLTMVRANLTTVVEHLNSCRDVQFPPLVKNRHVFAFRNGIYSAMQRRFYPYASAEAAALPDTLTAAKYFDVSIDEETARAACEEGTDPYRSISTPNLQKILDFQQMDEETCRWMYAMLGRLIYEVNSLDNWQVIPYIKGLASSGKSTILNRVCRMFYEVSDVGTLSNNIERKFGLSALYDKFIFIGPEIKSDMQLEQAEFQSLVSGEALQVAIKFQTAQSVDWKVPGILAGNEVPAWVDNGGSINRRIVLFIFGKKVTHGDMDLGKKLEAELPALIVKCNEMYRRAVEKYARDNIWVHLPKSFHRAKEELSESVNSIISFVRAGNLVISDDASMPYGTFIKMYHDYCKDQGIRPLKTTIPELRVTLVNVDLSLTQGRVTKPYWGNVVKDHFVLGIDADRSALDLAGGEISDLNEHDDLQG